MARGKANVELIGRLGADPETQSVGSSTVTKVSLAVGHKNTKSGEEETDWYNLNIWGKQGDTFAMYAHKGDQVSVLGRLRLRQYDAKDGTRKFSHDVEVLDFTLLGGKRDQQSDEGGETIDWQRPTMPVAPVTPKVAIRL